jgi:hypothetical protein
MMKRMRHQVHLCVLVGLVTCCGNDDSRSLDEDIALMPRKVSRSNVLAWVDDVPILVEDLKHQMGDDSTHDTSDALQSLIQHELLAQEARRRGLHADPQVERQQRISLANLLILREFEQKFTKKDIPYKLVKATRKNSESFHRRAKMIAAKIREVALARPLTQKEFKQIASKMQKDYPKVIIGAEHFNTPKRGFTVPSFADAAFALKKPGEISPVVRTHYGYHVIYLNRRLPARNRPLSEAEDEIRERIFDQAREQAFMLWIKELEERHKGTVQDSPLLLSSDQGT